MVSNPNFYAQSTTGTPNQIEDGVDFPHTGIIKALSLGLGQNYVISGFDLTAGANQYTQVNVSGGVICRDGKIISSGGHLVSGVTNLTMGYTTANGYHLLVVDSSNNIVFRSPSAVDKVPEYSTKDIIIAVVTYKGASTNPDFQYLTFKKAENSVSIAQNTGGSTYTEEGKITAPSGSAGQGIDIVTSTTNSDIRITPNGSGKIVLDGLNWPIADGSANQVLKTDGGGQLSFVAQTAAYTDSDAVNAVQAANLSLAGDVSIAAGKDLIVDTNSLVVDAANDRVGIGIAAPQHRLDIVELTDQFPFRLRGNEGNIRINKYGHVQIQNENSADSSTIDNPIWQIGQRDSGQFDIAFGNISTQLVAASDAILSLSRASNSATGNKQMGFFGATAVDRVNVGNISSAAVINPDVPNSPTAAEITSTQAAITALENKLDALIDALQLYGLIS